ncbi:YhgE/Pip domain-containing protein [Bifidobacterium pullorum subsp. saeculare]|uniref:YhgE/Pip domain-containing protein n=1 Tax=Bifidobacterium pullorum subsp. saeculare TaxID=78257 RepID=A0A938WZC2_9BIFI|nr:YhgE/Pip domain-containing protein [Bifidobacterium pullorum]MBM6700438.1 YhgE/Pip domain-containing protein [Bifidobacterium pullorum subsp. saeculare]
MKAMWRLFTDDVRRVTCNVVSVICLIGLVAIPSLFAWFNIAASWDPFGEVKRIKFAVASVDEGYKSDLLPVRITVGDEVVSALRENSELDWTFVSKDKAIEGTKAGDYYAAIVIPKDFSRRMMTFFSDDSRHALIDYYRNEKLSALNANLTGEGADEVAAQVNQEFVSTLTSTALGIASSLADLASRPEATDALGSFATNLGSTASALTDAGATLRDYETLAGTAGQLLDGADQLLGQTSGALESATKGDKDARSAADGLTGALESATGALGTALESSASGFRSVGTQVDDLLAKAGATASDTATALTHQAETVQSQIDAFQEMEATLRDLGAKHPQQADALGALADRVDREVVAPLTTLHAALTGAADAVVSGRDTALADQQAIKDLAAQAADGVGGLRADFTGQIKPHTDAIARDIASVTGTLKDGTGQLGSVLGGLATTVDGAKRSVDDVHALLGDMAGQLTDAGTQLADFQGKLAGALGAGDMAAVKDLLGEDPASFASALAAPVQLKRRAVFPVANFGSTMTPYYTFIPLWTASLLAAMTINPTVSRNRRRLLELGLGGRALKPHQLFLGHFGVFAVVSLLQSTVSCAGSLLFLRVQAVHPWLFMLSGWVSGLLYVLFAYTLVVSFGNIGKALAMFLLVLQVSGSAGSYPPQVLPGFMQALNPWLPITHSIDAMRAAIAGLYDGDYWRELGALLLFVPPLLLIGLLLRKLVARGNRWIAGQLERTQLI